MASVLLSYVHLLPDIKRFQTVTDKLCNEFPQLTPFFAGCPFITRSKLFYLFQMIRPVNELVLVSRSHRLLRNFIFIRLPVWAMIAAFIIVLCEGVVLRTWWIFICLHIIFVNTLPVLSWRTPWKLLYILNFCWVSCASSAVAAADNSSDIESPFAITDCSSTFEFALKAGSVLLSPVLAATAFFAS